MTVRIVIREPIPEETTQLITAVIKDEQDQFIPGESLDALTLTLYALDAQKTIINERDRQSILGENGGGVDQSGKLALELSPLDTIILDDSLKVEKRILLFEWTYDTGTKHGKQELLLTVVNLDKVPEEATPP